MQSLSEAHVLGNLVTSLEGFSLEWASPQFLHVALPFAVDNFNKGAKGLGSAILTMGLVP